MSVHVIYKQNGVKMMRPVPNREEYLSLRNGGFQKENVARIRQGDEVLKASLVQMNYSCLPNEDGSLKGSKRMSTTVGMDIDFVAPKELSPEEKQAWLNERMAQGARRTNWACRCWNVRQQKAIIWCSVADPNCRRRKI